MIMGNLICMPCCNSKPSSSARIADSSTCDIPVIPMFVMENTNLASPPQTPNHTLRRTEITSSGVIFRSTEDLLEEVNRQLTIHMPRR
ncbi:AC4 [Tomato leaf curl purple vein virus]|uniref:AC4 n=1 Tax=Tomato leaf curl purple vein virus TaxID=2021667 RepID=A0A223HEQ7_9GEMI|nr:AC4 [Tomato leaf curl purple vein virus]AST47733.1 AC4 [Tomato leaf curl purple vein virus]AST47739.1 AC4 [Tomato leaf curl purple vein virus]